MKVLIWHVHGSWTTSFVQGDHEYLVPVIPDRGPDGRGRARTWDWPASVRELSPEQLRDEPIDVLVLQRPHELHELAERWTGRRPGRDVPAIYVEHNAPQGPINDMRHPASDRDDVLLVHVTHFNGRFWDAGSTATRVVEHGIVDPGPCYTGELARAAVVVNEPCRRGRVAGTDLLPAFERAIPLDLFGMGSEPLGGRDLPQAAMHAEIGRRRAYVHPYRWTSLGLSLLEAMAIGLPVVALATTEAPAAVPPAAGAVSNDLDVLQAALRTWVADPQIARDAGACGRAHVLDRYGLGRFLARWDAVLTEVAS